MKGVCIMAAVVLASCYLTRTAGADLDSALSRPERPHEFASAGEVKDYLRNLQLYYSAMGRSRYGKRDIRVNGDFENKLPEKLLLILRRVPLVMNGSVRYGGEKTESEGSNETKERKPAMLRAWMQRLSDCPQVPCESVGWL